MKKNHLIIIVLIILEIIVLGICILTYNVATSDVQVEETKRTEKIEREAIFSKSDYPKVDASDNMQDLANSFMKNFTGDETENLKANYTGEEKAYKRLIDGNVDLVISKEPSKEDLDYASQKGVEIDYTPLVIDAFVFYVNNENPVYNLSIDQIKEIYTGKINKWSEVGGNDESIRAFQRNANSENQNGMIELVMGDTEMGSPVIEEKNNTDEIQNDITADYDNGIDAIGYSYYYYAKKIYDQYSSKKIDGIKLLRVNDIKPSYDNIQNNRYPLKTTYYVAVRKVVGVESNATKLRDAMLSSRGKSVAKEAGYVPSK